MRRARSQSLIDTIQSTSFPSIKHLSSAVKDEGASLQPSISYALPSQKKPFREGNEEGRDWSV